MGLNREKFNNSNYHDRQVLFYLVCEKKEYTSEVKKLFSLNPQKEKFDSHILTLGVAAALQADNQKLMNMIYDFANKMQIEIDNKHKSAVYNYALLLNKHDIAEQLNGRWKTLEQDSKEKVELFLTEEGKFYIISGTSLDGAFSNKPVATAHRETQLRHCYMNTFRFCIENKIAYPFQLCDAKGIEIEKTLIEKAFIDYCYLKDSSVINFMLNEPTIKKVIDESKNIGLYLNEKTENLDFKNKVEHMQKIILLKNKIANELITSSLKEGKVQKI